MSSYVVLFQSINARLQRYYVLMIVTCFAVGGVFCDAIGSLKPAVQWLFAAMTLVGALRVGVKDIKDVLLSPFQIVTALIVLHVLFPALVYLLGRAGLARDPNLYTGLALLAAVPTGVSSIMWVTLMRGNVALGLTLITLDSVLSPLFVPVTVMLLAGTIVEFDASSLMASLVRMIVIPTIIGVTLHELTRGRVAVTVGPVGAVFSKLALGAIIAINVAASWPRMASYTGNFMALFALLLAMVLLGFAVAYLVARSVIRDRADAVAVTFIAGMRNISAGVVLAMEGFDPLVSIPVTGAILFQQPVAAVMARLLQEKDTSDDRGHSDSVRSPHGGNSTDLTSAD